MKANIEIQVYRKKTILQYIIMLFSGLYGILIISSCSGADPVIYNLQWDLQVFKEYPSRDVYERLILHILADDDDGFDEIYELYVINDESERYWRITQDEWKILTIDNVDWIAINSIVSEQYEKLPRGEYRVLVLDYSGFRDERNFYITYKYSQKEETFYSENSNVFVVDSVPSNIFPELRQFSNNTYVPLIETRFLNTTNDTIGSLFMQLVYPASEKDIAGNVLTSEHKELISLLGENGTIYTIEPNKKVSFVPTSVNRNKRVNYIAKFLVYLHYRLEDVVTVSAGPFTIEMNEDTLIYEDSIEDVVNAYR